MEAILIVMIYFGGGTMSTERVSSIDECKKIVAQIREQSQHHISAYCIPAKKLESSGDK